MIIGILKEAQAEKRVALLPEGLKTLKKLNTTLWVEKNAGSTAFASDDEYAEAGGEIKDRKEILSNADVLLMIQPPEEDVIRSTKKDQVIFSVVNPFFNLDIVKALTDVQKTVFSMDLIPRTTRGQAMDILSSQATISGYKAVLEAAFRLPNFFPMFMSAAGTIRPAKVLILGAGVAGLQAIASARKLGAIVEVFDVRSAVKEEVKSLGGKFIEVEGATEDKGAGGYAVEQTEDFKKKQKQLIHDHVAKSNVVICTAQIFGRHAPVLIEKATVEAMPAGSIIIDLAASTGGNCEVTKNEETIVYEGVTVIGQSNYPTDMPIDASRMFGNNLLNFLKLIVGKEGELVLDWEDEIISGTCLVHDGEVKNERVKLNLES